MDDAGEMAAIESQQTKRNLSAGCACIRLNPIHKACFDDWFKRAQNCPYCLTCYTSPTTTGPPRLPSRLPSRPLPLHLSLSPLPPSPPRTRPPPQPRPPPPQPRPQEHAIVAATIRAHVDMAAEDVLARRRQTKWTARMRMYAYATFILILCVSLCCVIYMLLRVDKRGHGHGHDDDNQTTDGLITP